MNEEVKVGDRVRLIRVWSGIRGERIVAQDVEATVTRLAGDCSFFTNLTDGNAIYVCEGDEWELLPSNTTPAPPPEDFAAVVKATCDFLADLLISKNIAYGDSVSSPRRIFSKLDPTDALRVRIDDKLARIERGQDGQEDTLTDLIGYLILLKIQQEENDR